MKYLPNWEHKNKPKIITPLYLAEALVKHFNPYGKILEPCSGTGSFLKYLPKDTLWCEIERGIDFFDFNEKVDWIITNPPWNQVRQFLQHSLELADNICFLLCIIHLWTKARLRDIKSAGFGIKEILIFDTPEEFPQMGFQVGMFWLKRGYSGKIEFGELKIQKERRRRWELFLT